MECGLIMLSMGLTNHLIPNLNFKIMVEKEERTLLNSFPSCMVNISLDWSWWWINRPPFLREGIYVL